MRRAVRNVVQVLGPRIQGLDACELHVVDRTLCEADGSAALDRLGANAVLGVSVAAAIAGARSRCVPLYQLFGNEPLLPLPMVNVISGGAHARGGVSIQDVLVVPVGASTFGEALEWASRIRTATAEVMTSRGLSPWLVADEGGFGPSLRSSREAIELVQQGLVRADLDGQVALALDVAATQFQADGIYRLDGRTMTTHDLIEETEAWCREFAIVSIEDPLASGGRLGRMERGNGKMGY